MVYWLWILRLSRRFRWIILFLTIILFLYSSICSNENEKITVVLPIDIHVGEDVKAQETILSNNQRDSIIKNIDNKNINIYNSLNDSVLQYVTLKDSNKVEKNGRGINQISSRLLFAFVIKAEEDLEVCKMHYV